MNSSNRYANWPYAAAAAPVPTAQATPVAAAASGAKTAPEPRPKAAPGLAVQSGAFVAPAPGPAPAAVPAGAAGGPKRASAAIAAPERKPVVKDPAPIAEAVETAAAAPAKRPTKTGPKAGVKTDQPAAPDEVLKAGSEVRQPSVNKRATQAAMQAQMSQTVEPSHDPGAAKAVFSPSPERVLVAITPTTPKKNPKLSNNWKTVPLEQLTDADVLAMPDAEYMNEVQLAYFKRKLQQLKHDILVNAGETTEHLREDTSVVPDPADRATIEEEHALELRTRDRERKLLKKIEQSIARIDSGDYGYCDETGEPIGVGRLLARPTASLSIEAQQRRELKQKLFGD